MDNIKAIVLYLPIVHDEYFSGKRSFVVTPDNTNGVIAGTRYSGYHRVSYISVNNGVVYLLFHDGSERYFGNIPYCILREPSEEKGGSRG